MDFSIPEQSHEQSKLSMLQVYDSSTDAKSKEDFSPQGVHTNLLTWQDAKEAKLRQQQLSSLRRDEQYLQEVPNINPVSRRMAELLYDPEQRPVTYINSPATPEPQLDYKRIKNNLKRMGDSGATKFDVRISKNQLTISVSPTVVANKRTQNDSQSDYLKELKKKMDLVPKKAPSKPDLGRITNTYLRTTAWKDKCKEKIEKLRGSLEGQDEGKHAQEKPLGKCCNISPAYRTVGYSTGKDLENFKSKSKPLVSYKKLIE